MPKVVKSKAVKVEAVASVPENEAVVVPQSSPISVAEATIVPTVEPSVKKDRKANKYLVFFKQFTAEWKAAHPEAKFKEIGAEAGKKWRSMSKEEKSVL